MINKELKNKLIENAIQDVRNITYLNAWILSQYEHQLRQCEYILKWKEQYANATSEDERGWLLLGYLDDIRDMKNENSIVSDRFKKLHTFLRHAVVTRNEKWIKQIFDEIESKHCYTKKVVSELKRMYREMCHEY